MVSDASWATPKLTQEQYNAKIEAAQKAAGKRELAEGADEDLHAGTQRALKAAFLCRQPARQAEIVPNVR